MGYYKRARAHAQQTLAAADTYRFYYYDFQTATLVPMPTPRRGEQMGPVVCVDTGFVPLRSAFYRTAGRRPQCFRQRPTHRRFVVYVRSACRLTITIDRGTHIRPYSQATVTYGRSGARPQVRRSREGFSSLFCVFLLPCRRVARKRQTRVFTIVVLILRVFFFFFCLQWQRPARSPQHTKPRPGSA